MQAAGMHANSAMVAHRLARGDRIRYAPSRARIAATEIDPTYAAAFNNLAVAYEQQGDAEKARAAYEKAVALEPNNQQIRQNYDLFKEINDRSNRRSDR